MKQRTATFFSLLISCGSASVFLIPLSIMLLPFPLANLEQAYVAVLRLDGVLFGFTLAISAFLLGKMKLIERSWGYCVLISVFFSLLISILTAFVGLLSTKLPPGFVIVSISFALGAILSIIMWLQDVAFPHEEQAHERRK